jgi:hypothetical protein
MIDKPVAQIGIEDLQRLVANKVSEPRSLEYKQALPGGTDARKRSSSLTSPLSRTPRFSLASTPVFL